MTADLDLDLKKKKKSNLAKKKKKIIYILASVQKGSNLVSGSFCLNFLFVTS